MGQAIGRIEILPDPLALAHHVAKWMTQAALAAEDSFRVSLSGGSTPKTLYGLLASDEFRDPFPWQLVSWYWGDERFVPHDHPDSNYRMTRGAMLAKAPVPRENIHPIPTDGAPEHAARRYERTLQEAYGATQTFLPEMLPKIMHLRTMCAERGLHPMIEVDGGENTTTAAQAAAAGATAIVAGSAIFGARDYAKAIADIRASAAAAAVMS